MSAFALRLGTISARNHMDAITAHHTRSSTCAIGMFLLAAEAAALEAQRQ